MSKLLSVCYGAGANSTFPLHTARRGQTFVENHRMLKRAGEDGLYAAATLGPNIERTGTNMEEAREYNWRKALLWGLVSLALSALGIAAVLRITKSQDVVRGVLAIGLRTLAISSGLVVASWVAAGGIVRYVCG